MAKGATPVRVQLLAKTIGEQVATWRRLRGVTAKLVAERANVSVSTLSRLENGDPSVSFETLLRVCGAIQIDSLLEDVLDPMNTDYGRARAGQSLPQRIR